MKGNKITGGILIDKNIEATQEQIDALAQRLLPEIKRFFADEGIQKEFSEWQKKRNEQSR